VQEHLDRIGVAATATNIRGSSFNRIKWALPADPPTVSIVVLPRTGGRFCRSLDSIWTRSTYPNIEIIVVDDGAFRPPVKQYLRDHSDWLTIIDDTRDISDSAQRNIAAASARGDVLCFIHDDIEVLTDTWLEEMVGTLSYPGIGAVGAKLLYPDLTIQHAGIVVGIGGSVGNPHRVNFDTTSPGYFGRLLLAQCPSAVSWACMAVRREAFDAVGGFNEEHFTGLYGDVDFCLRLSQAGWRTGWTPNAELIHFERPGDSRPDGENAIRFDRDIRMLQSTWGAWLEADPAYNPNLSLAHESFPLAWPPRRTLA
jgi:GT2 family glycosyltransferase